MEDMNAVPLALALDMNFGVDENKRILEPGLGLDL
jgi:hypothetical protein